MDLSYYCCIAFEGPENQLCDYLSCLTSKTAVSHFASDKYRDGSVEGHAILYHPNSFRYEAIGPVTFMWQPNNVLNDSVNLLDSKDIIRNLWIWCHPSIHDELINVLIDIFKLNESSSTDTADTSTEGIDVEEQKCEKDEKEISEGINSQMVFASKVNFYKVKAKFQKKKVYTAGEIKMSLLKDKLVRFRLIDPDAYTILSSVLELENVDGCHTEESIKTSQCKRQKLIESLQNRHLNYYIPPGSIFGLTVRDPRLVSRHKQKKFAPEIGSSNISGIFHEIITSEMASSPLWDNKIRNEVTVTQISENEINKERSNYVVPSVSINLGSRGSRVPILLIHQKGTDGFASGWDLIVPLGWGVAFWIPLVLNGGRVTGIRDLHFVNLDTSQPSFPVSYPDTKAGKMYEEKCRVEELTVYYKRPKAKRPNFTAFGVPNPFYMPWEFLIKEWKNEVNCLDSAIFFPTIPSTDLSVHETFPQEIDGKKDFYILRQKEIQELLNLFKLLNQIPKKNVETQGRLQMLKHAYNHYVTSIINSGSHGHFVNSYVLVSVKCKGRGCPSKHSGIYILSDCDTEKIKRSVNFLGPVEPNHASSKIISKTEETPSPVISSEQSKSNELCEKESSNESCSKNKINPTELERPKSQSLKDCSYHKMIGYISEGGFSSILGKGCGTGHCSFVGLLIMLKNCINSLIAPQVLIREQHSFQYRVCSIEIIRNYL